MIDKFYWTSSEINAFNNNGTLDTISYLRWNTFCDKIQEVLSEGNNSWDTTWGSLTATKMSSSDKELTADRFNAARYNIGSHYSTGISTVSTGDIIYGSYFITLQNSLNNWIDTL